MPQPVSFVTSYIHGGLFYLLIHFSQFIYFTLLTVIVFFFFFSRSSDRNLGDEEFGEEPLPYGMDEDEYDYDDEIDAATDAYNGNNNNNKNTTLAATNENAPANVNYLTTTESMEWAAGTLNALDGAVAAPAAAFAPIEEADPVRRLVLNAVAKAVAAEAAGIAQVADPTLQQQRQQQQHHLQSIAAALKPTAAKSNLNLNTIGAEVVTPGGPLGAGPSALVSHLSGDMPIDGEEIIDTATSPALHAAAAQARLAAQAHLSRQMAGGTMTAAAAKAAGAGRTKEQLQTNADTPVGSMDSAGGEGSRGKRPRRAASGGVQGAVAAATSDWGLDLVSPPPKRSHSVPDALDLGKGTAAAARRDRNTLLRRALQNDAAAQGQQTVGTEADAISALVSMNTTTS